jgi:ABC-type phosphate/phosphonate transport system substrate-binding protein
MLKHCITLFLLGLSFIQSVGAVETDNNEKIVFGGSKIGVKVNIQQGTDTTFNLAFDKLMAHQGIDLNMQIYDSSQALYEAFTHGDINAVFASPIEFLQLEEQLGEMLIALNYQNAPIKQSYVVLVRKNDHFTDINQLKNKRFSLPLLQDVSVLFLNTLLLDNQQSEIPAFFSEVFDSKNANVAIMDVFFGKSDITIVRESEFKNAIALNPQVESQLTVLIKSPSYINMVGAGKKSIDSKKFKDIMFSMTGVSKTESGKKLFKVIQADELHLISRADLSEVNALMSHYKTLKKIN